MAIARVGLADALVKAGKRDDASKLILDFRVDWRITSDVSFNFRYGIFIPNRGNPSDTFADQVRQFVYGGISYAF